MGYGKTKVYAVVTVHGKSAQLCYGMARDRTIQPLAYIYKPDAVKRAAELTRGAGIVDGYYQVREMKFT
jgi:hypothetical protein